MRNQMLVALVVTALGCGPQSKTPVIQHAIFPATASIGSDGLYDLAGELDVHDDAEVVASLRVTIPATGTRMEYPINLFDGPVQLTIRFPSALPKGPVEYDYTLISASGVESLVAKQMVTLQ